MSKNRPPSQGGRGGGDGVRDALHQDDNLENVVGLRRPFVQLQESAVNSSVAEPSDIDKTNNNNNVEQRRALRVLHQAPQPFQHPQQSDMRTTTTTTTNSSSVDHPAVEDEMETAAGMDNDELNADDGELEDDRDVDRRRQRRRLNNSVFASSSFGADCSSAFEMGASSSAASVAAAAAAAAAVATISSADAPSVASQHPQAELDLVAERHQRAHRLRAWMLVDATGYYAVDVFNSLRQREVQLSPNPRYLAEVQTELEPRHVAHLLDWMVDAKCHFGLTSRTLYLAFDYCHRFLSHSALDANRLQLLGTSALLVASKFEEKVAPTIDELLGDRRYTRIELLHMERMLLVALEFKMAAPTAMDFFSIFALAGSLPQDAYLQARYMMDCFHLAHQSLLFRPSVRAAASCALALRILGRDPWPKPLAQLTGFSLYDVWDCMRAVHVAYEHDGHENAPKNAHP